MRVSQLIRGLELLGRAGSIHAEHDQIFMDGPHPDELSALDNDELEHLGFFWDEEEGWSHFT